MRYEEFKALRLRVLQPEGVERFGIDAILLADFASRRLHKSDRLLDLGTGSGIVALLLLARGISYAAGVEIYPPAAEAARENARINSLPLEVFSGDLREELPFPEKSFDLAVANLFPRRKRKPSARADPRPFGQDLFLPGRDARRFPTAQKRRTLLRRLPAGAPD